MQALLTWLWEHLLELLPFVVVSEWEQGFVVRLGRITRRVAHNDGLFRTGFHLRIPMVDSVITEPLTEQPIDLPVVNITTADSKSIALSANITYKVVDPAKLWRRVADFDTSLEKLATGILAQYGSAYTWEDLQQDRAGIQQALRANLTKHLKAWGVRVVRVHLTDFVPAKQFNVFGGVSL
jgi:regulator of protease activity HflC (stomatin/prohibitin superfamily)